MRAGTARQPFRQRHAVALGLLLLLLSGWWLGVSRMELTSDELWNLWQTFGTPSEVLRRTPFDWPPLSFITLGLWRNLTGIAPVSLRAASWLTMALAAALVYRAALEMAGARAARLSLLAFGALGYVVRVASEIRGYALSVVITALALWLAGRAFRTPWSRRAAAFTLALGAVAGLHAWVYLPGGLAMIGIGVWTLVAYPRRVWRWLVALGPGLVVAALPLAWVAGSVRGRVGTWPPQDKLAETVALFRQFTVFRYDGAPVWAWALLAALALAGLALGMRQRGVGGRVRLGLLAWGLGLPLLLSLTHYWLGFYQQHYSMGAVVGWGLLLGLGLARWGRRAEPWTVLALLLLSASLQPSQLRYFEGFARPWLATMRYVDERLRPGDVLVVDPLCCTGNAYELDVIQRMMFPHGLPLTRTPGTARRVWYLHQPYNHDAATLQAVAQGRVPREFIGPSYHFIQLYEGPPDAQGQPLADGLRFHGAELVRGRDPWPTPGLPPVLHEDEAFTVRLWWRADAAPTLDYSVNVALGTLGADAPLAVQDGPPQSAALDDLNPPPPSATSRWAPGTLVADDRTLRVPLLPQTFRQAYTVRVTVYFWETPSAPLAVLPDVLPLTIEAW